VTVAVAGVGMTLALLVAAFLGALGRAGALATRAQLAADAAALAAVAESAPQGGGAPEEVARDYAARNGARLNACSCPPGATSVQVEVVVGGAAAEARAIFDPEALAPAPLEFNSSGLHPRLADAVAELVRASRGALRVVSGWRSYAEQQRLWRDALDTYGSPERADDWVARPGTSAHERGVAVDLGGDLRAAVALVESLQLPLYRPLDHEPWHFELAV